MLAVLYISNASNQKKKYWLGRGLLGIAAATACSHGGGVWCVAVHASFGG